MSETLPQKDNINRKITVLKFGGNSVADADRMHEVSLIIKKYLNKEYGGDPMPIKKKEATTDKATFFVMT